MNYQIHFPRTLLQDNTITNKQKNILMLLYLYRNADGITRLTPQDIQKELGFKNYQEVSRQIKLLIDKEYVQITKNPQLKTETFYKLIIDNKDNFIQLDSQLYKQFKKFHDLIVEYFYYKNVYMLVGALKIINNRSYDEFEFIKIGNYKYNKYCDIKKDLYDNGLITLDDYKVNFVKEQDVEMQVKFFAENYKS